MSKDSNDKLVNNTESSDGENDKSSFIKDDSNSSNVVSQKKISNLKQFAIEKRIGITCIGIAVLIAILIIMIFLVFSKDDTDNSMAKYLDNMRTQEIIECDIEQVNFFFKSYYDALSEGNTTIIEGLYDDPSKANITTEVSEIVEKFDNIKVYVTKGLKDKELVAFVYNELKFPNIETLAPAVDTYYLSYNELNNSLKIITNMFTDPSIIKFINVVAKKEPVRSLLTNTNDKLNEALEADSQFKSLYLIMQSMTDNAEYKTPEE